MTRKRPTKPQPAIRSVDARWTTRQLQAALTAPPRGLCRIYDAQGRLIATMDPVTRQRVVVGGPPSPPAPSRD